MKRRELLASGVSLGLAFVADPLSAPEAAAALSFEEPTFFQGLLNGGDLADWGLLLSARNRLVTGLAQAPGAGQGEFLPAINLRGRVVDTVRFRGNLFDIEDRAFQSPLGMFDARVRRGVVSGQFSLDGTPGAFMASKVATDPRAARPFAGRYLGQLQNTTGQPLFTLDIRVQTNGAWVISNITPTQGGAPIQGIFTGFGATNHGRTDGYGFSNNDFAGCLCAIPTAASGHAMGSLNEFNFATNYRGNDLILNLQRTVI